MILLFLALGCRGTSPRSEEIALPPFAPIEQPRAAHNADHPEILLVTVDALRADHLPAYGYPRDTAPRLSALAAQGVVFERAYASAPWEAPALASLMSGLYAFQHGVDRAVVHGEAVEGLPELSAAADTLAERLGAAGYETWGVSTTPYAADHSGLEQGFDHFTDLGAREDGEAALAALAQATPGERPRFIWLHLRDPRSPWVPRSPWYETWSAEPTPATLLSSRWPDADRDARQRGLGPQIAAYDSEIRAVDQEIGAAVDALHLREGALIVVVGAEGEELMDHGKLGRRSSVFDEQVHVPLIVVGPGVTPGTRVSSPVSTVDLLPTLVEAATGTAPVQGSGISLVPALSGQALPDRMLSFELRGADGSILRTVVWGRWKLIWSGTGSGATHTWLYDLDQDPGELHDVAAEHAELTAPLWQAMQAWLRAAPQVRAGHPSGGGG